ncbi:MAG TPA: hypothetical protein VL916_07615, partial [Ilumatobacteraceae bacterium]|nr:hypothetical protein [Ilumatobacteraceae bacterium]
MVVDDHPINTAGGSYAFEDVAPGEYRIRATLADNIVDPPPAVPSFDIRHGAEPDEPVWIERTLTLDPGDVGKTATLRFADTPQIDATSVSFELERDRLDDMANIYFRMRQFVDWVKSTLTPQTGPTVPIYTFASEIDGHAFNEDRAFYTPDGRIYLGPAVSAYAMRDGVFDGAVGEQAPENVEWHEFVHHLFRTFITDSAPCADSINHGGYDNPDTCDSMNEGFASFLPPLAAQSIDGATDSYYDGLFDLEWNTKAWEYRNSSDGETRSAEDLAVSALFWDLVDANADSETTLVVGQNALHVPTTLNDQTSMTIDQLWDLLTSAHPRTVVALRAAFGRPALTLDPDHDGTPDLATLDQLFLMHGFFPIDADQGFHPPDASSHYDVAYAQRADPSADRNAAVGRSSHKVYDENGIVVDFMIPRSNTPLADNANIELHVEDASGAPLSGAEVTLRVDYPGQQQTVVRQLGAGDGSLLHLELPPHFDYPLPRGAAVPACDPTHDVHVQVTMTTRINGFVSEDTHTLDNCTYLLASEAATGPAALAFTSTFPMHATAPISTV